MKHMLNLPKKVYFRAGSKAVALRELSEVYGCHRAYIVTDVNLYRAGTIAPIGDFLRKHGLRTAEFFSLDGKATVEAVEDAVTGAKLFEPDVILGIGGGTAMTAAKAVWMRYENPALSLADAAAEPEKIAFGGKSRLVLIATDFTTGAQNTPFAVLDNDGETLVIKSFSILPEISITDADFTKTLTATQVEAGAKALASRAIRAFTDERCDEFAQGLLSEAVASVLGYTGYALTGCPIAREKLHNAAAVAGAALGNVLEAGDIAAPRDLPRSGERIEALAKRVGCESADELYNRLAL